MTSQEFLFEKYLKVFNEKVVGYSPELPINSDYNAVIVEPRIDPKILPIIKNHLYFLNNCNSKFKWGLQVFHGDDNQSFIYDILKDIKNVHFVNTGVKDFTKIEYNQYIKSCEFWEQVKGKKVLMFQTDTLLLRHGIEEFLKYDYIGAPWTKPKENKFIGNGGLSLRTREVMLDISKNHKDYEPRWEDIFFVKWLSEKNNIPEMEVAMKFSVENLYHHNPLGVHNPVNVSPYLLEMLFDNSLRNL